MNERFFIRKDGTYAGSFSGGVVTVTEPQADDSNAPAEQRQVETWPNIPADLIELDAPPAHGADVLTGFKVDGNPPRVVGGSWDTSGRPVPVVPGAKFAAALVAAGVMDQKQADAVMAEMAKGE